MEECLAGPKILQAVPCQGVYWICCLPFEATGLNLDPSHVRISVLKKKLGSSVVPTAQLPLVDSMGVFKPEPEEIFERRLRQVKW